MFEADLEQIRVSKLRSSMFEARVEACRRCDSRTDAVSLRALKSRYGRTRLRPFAENPWCRIVACGSFSRGIDEIRDDSRRLKSSFRFRVLVSMSIGAWLQRINIGPCSIFPGWCIRALLRASRISLLGVFTRLLTVEPRLRQKMPSASALFISQSLRPVWWILLHGVCDGIGSFIR
ncbi:hypothetical protein J3F83DRAFT_454927 [Trichoderma novae-zelandiae]